LRNLVVAPAKLCAHALGSIEALHTWEATGTAGTIVVTSSVHARHAASASGIYEMTKASTEALIRKITVSTGRGGFEP